MSLQSQVDALVAQQGGDPREQELLFTPVADYGMPTSTPGANTTLGVLLDSGTRAFHKPFSGVNVQTATAYNHHPDQVPINECAAWRLAAAIGPPLSDLVAPCVMWSHHGEAGALVLGLHGVNLTREPFLNAPDQCRHAAFFDSLVAQQDRHLGNLRWDEANGRLGLYDHGYTFARPGHTLNSSLFVSDRWRQGAEHLDQWELDGLDRLLASGDLVGLADILPADRADGLRDRAARMHQHGRLLLRGEF